MALPRPPGYLEARLSCRSVRLLPPPRLWRRLRRSPRRRPQRPHRRRRHRRLPPRRRHRQPRPHNPQREVRAPKAAVVRPRPSSARSPPPSAASPPRQSPIPTVRPRSRRLRARKVARAINRGRPTTRRAGSAPAPIARRARAPASERRSAAGIKRTVRRAPDPSAIIHCSRSLSRLTGAELPKPHRTFGRRRRHMGVGDFSAQCLNGRRQAMIFRLRGVALFEASVRGVPTTRKRQERPDHLVVVRHLRRFLNGRLDERGRRRRLHRQAQTCTLQIHCGLPSRVNSSQNSSSQNSMSVQNGHAASKWRAHSQIAHAF